MQRALFPLPDPANVGQASARLNRASKGKENMLAGLAAEGSVERLYQDQGMKLLARRWRGGGGELDLVFETHAGLHFVAVKKARSHDIAATRISKGQIRRIFCAATCFVTETGRDPLTDMHFDAALVDQAGRIKILHDALIGQ